MRFVFTILFLIFSLGIFAESSYYQVLKGENDLRNDVRYLIEKDKAFSIAEIMALEGELFIQNSKDKQLFFNYHSKPCWFKLSIENHFDVPMQNVLYVQNNLLYDIQFYVVDSLQNVTHYVNGNKYERSKHSFDHRYPVLPISFESKEKKEVYIYVNNLENSWVFLLMISSELDFFKKNYYYQFYLAIYYGFILLIIVINIYLYTRIRRKVLVFYIGYLISSALFQMLKDGFLFEFFLSDYPDLSFNLISQIILTTIIFNVLFFQSYFNSKIYIKKYDRFLSGIIALCIILFPFTFFDAFNDNWLPFNPPLILLTMCFVAFGGVKMLKKKRINAIYYLLGYSILFIGIMFTILGVIGWSEDAFLQSFMLKTTTIIEIMVLTIAIVESFRRRQKEILELALVKQKEVSRLQGIANAELEKQVGLNKKTAASEMKALRAQMNPHFTFNSMNSIQLFLINNDTEAAQKYLTKFSKLMRMILDHSKLDRIYVQDEIEGLELYLELEGLRFKDKFEWKINVSEEIETELDQIPSMLIQPFAENAIWHGLMHKEDGVGKIEISFELEANSIVVSIKDNGVGRTAAKTYKESSSTKRKSKSMGMQITVERLQIINEMLNTSMKFEINDLKDVNGKPLGTEIILNIPLEGVG